MSEVFTTTLDGYGIRISMDGVNRALDNNYIERFWRALTDLKAGIKRYMGFYNRERFHASHDYLTPDQMYDSKFQETEAGLRAVA